MIIENLPIPSFQLRSEDSKEVSQNQITLNYRNFLGKACQMTYFQNYNNLENKKTDILRKIGVGKLISKKMRIKLLNWLEKLNFETFEFSVQTFIESILILDQYLSLTNEPSTSLQLIGCACLYLSSKKHEPTIVAAQCYVTASANCFTQKKLIEKQMEIYQTLGFNITLPNIMRDYKVMKNNKDFEIFNNFNDQNILKLFVQITKNIDFLQFHNQKILVMISAIFQHQKRLPTSLEILEYLKISNAF